MDTELSQHETRVLGCLFEKEITTPEQYPLSLNALTNACNQKSNRNPVLNMDEQTVQAAIDELVKKRFILGQHASGRVEKYQHRFCNTEFSKLQISSQELAIICILFLRGPQTPGELRTRTNRLCKFNDLSEVESALENLKSLEGGPFVVKLAREPGRREARFAHLFSGDVESASVEQEVEQNNDSPSDVVNASINAVNVDESERISALESLVTELQSELETIKQELGME